jgi:hypothetical protein
MPPRSTPEPTTEPVTEPVTEPGLTATLVAVVVGVVGDTPYVLTAGERDGLPALPAGPLESGHRSLQAGLRSWVERQTGLTLGFVEQLYTFADADRAGDGRVVSVGYLGLTRLRDPGPQWRPWYELFPWEDRRGDDAPGTRELLGRLRDWSAPSGADDGEAARRRLRCALTFGLEDSPWVPELTIQRYELFYEAGLVGESPDADGWDPASGQPMLHDHRRIVATAVSRLRAKLQYRPVVFELLPESFTLGRLQSTVEALAGQRLHTQNFRRLITQQELVEETGERTSDTGGRPARLFRFRREVLDLRAVAGTRLPAVRKQ